MADEDTKAFTVRMPIELARQVDSRADINRRSRSAEVIYLVEQALDRQAADLQKEVARVKGSQGPPTGG